MVDASRANHVACPHSLFSQGAWSCLIQNIDLKARHSSFSCAEWTVLGKSGAGEKEW